MKEIVLRVDATFGLNVKVGDEVPTGHRLGVSAKTAKVLCSPASGVVREIAFDPDRHEFRIVIDPA